MTWDQFLALLLGLMATALVRLLDRWLPPSQDNPEAKRVIVDRLDDSPPEGT